MYISLSIYTWQIVTCVNNDLIIFNTYIYIRIQLHTYIIITGWWYTYPSEKYEFVSWDDYSQLNGKSKK